MKKGGEKKGKISEGRGYRESECSLDSENIKGRKRWWKGRGTERKQRVEEEKGIQIYSKSVHAWISEETWKETTMEKRKKGSIK